MITLSMISFALGVACYSISQLQQHGKLKRMDTNSNLGFWGAQSYRRKYAHEKTAQDLFKNGALKVTLAPDNWYYKLIKSKYKERWLTSTWLTVFLTDGYHFAQFLFFIFLSLGITLLLNFSLLGWISVWLGVHAIHSFVYRVLSK